MTMTYDEAANLFRSEKITLITIEAVERVKLFAASGADWTRTVNYFVVGVKDDGVIISDWEFEPKTLTLKIIGGANPKTRKLSLTYRMFFSSAPLILPYDLDEGEPVEWNPWVSSIGSVGQQLDDENTGIVLETSSSITMNNAEGQFDDIFDSLIFENQAVLIYSWFPMIPIQEKFQLFDGVVDTKDYNPSTVMFRVTDFVFKLKNYVDLGLFSETDGVMLPALIGTPKRRIYGQADNVQAVSFDATLDGFELTGTISGIIDSLNVSGTGTFFLKELSPGDKIFFEANNETHKYEIETIASDISLVLTKALEINLISQSVSATPKIPYRYKNRPWQVANHKLRNPVTTIIEIISGNAFRVSSTLDIFEKDQILVNGVVTNVRRVSGDIIITNNSISPAPSLGQTIEKRPIQKVFFGSKELFINRDYTYTNSTYSNIIFNDLAEFNITEERSLTNALSFVNGSRSVTTTDVVDFRSILESRDWIRSASIAEPEWYEILEVRERELILRTNFTGATATKQGKQKVVDYIEENSLITVNCLGMEYAGVWMKTPSDCVRHLILNDAGFPVVNEARFAKAKTDCDFIVCMLIPEALGDNAPLVRDTITKINESVFGSLYGDSSQNISYSILNAKKPELSEVIRDDDIKDFKIQNNQAIINSVKLNYSPYVDVYSGEASFKSIVKNSKFVDDLIGIKSTNERTVYLYEDDKVNIIAQRIILFNSLSSSNVTVTAKMNLAKITVNDKLYLSLDRLYRRYSGRDRRKIGTVSGVKRTGDTTEITFTDLGNVYNRIPSIAPNITPEFFSASEDEKLKWGFILSNDTETPDESSEVGLGAHIIG